MLNKLIILVSLLGTTIIPTTAQVNWSVALGGGMSYMNDYFGGHPLLNYQEDYLLEGGMLVYVPFREGGMLGGQTGLLLRHSGFKDVPLDRDAIGDGGISSENIPWDLENVQSVRNWSLKVPLTLKFDVFEPISLLFGGHVNYMMKTGMKNNLISSYQTWIPGVHLGLLAPLGQRFNIEGLVESDVSPRLTGTGGSLSPDINYREFSYSIRLNYQLNSVR